MFSISFGEYILVKSLSTFPLTDTPLYAPSVNFFWKFLSVIGILAIAYLTFKLIFKLKLKDIIKEAVHEYGKELYHNIIINDLDNYGLELLEYRGDKPLYLLYDEAA